MFWSAALESIMCYLQISFNLNSTFYYEWCKNYDYMKKVKDKFWNLQSLQFNQQSWDAEECWLDFYYGMCLVGRDQCVRSYHKNGHNLDCKLSAILHHCAAWCLPAWSLSVLSITGKKMTVLVDSNSCNSSSLSQIMIVVLLMLYPCLDNNVPNSTSHNNYSYGISVLLIKWLLIEYCPCPFCMEHLCPSLIFLLP